MEASNVLHILQTAIAPCALISGVGLVLLSMTNRFGRPIDRIHVLCQKLNGANDDEAQALLAQIALLSKRSKILQLAIAMAVLSLLFVGLIIILIFFEQYFAVQLYKTIVSFFILAVLTLIVALSAYLYDIYFSLDSIKIELELYLKK